MSTIRADGETSSSAWPLLTTVMKLGCSKASDEKDLDSEQQVFMLFKTVQKNCQKQESLPTLTLQGAVNISGVLGSRFFIGKGQFTLGTLVC